MRAVIIATGVNENLPEFKERFPLPLFPLLGRPFVQLLVERIAGQGIRRFDFILSHLPEMIETSLGTGARWGAEFRYHLARDTSRPYGLLKTLLQGERELVLLAHADRLPLLPDLSKEQRHVEPAAERGPILYCFPSQQLNDRREWTGWALLSPGIFDTMPLNPNESELEAFLMRAANRLATEPSVTECLSLRSYRQVLAAKSAVLAGKFPDLLLPMKEHAGGIRIAPNASVDPSVYFTPPVFVGENCRIGPGVHLGPEAVIESSCVLEADCAVTNSVILSSSYLGEGLEVSDAIVDKTLLVNVRLNTAISVTDNYILGNLASNQIQPVFSRLLSRSIAVVLLFHVWPLILLTAIWLKITRPGPVWFKRECVRLPVINHSPWRTFQLYSFDSGSDARGGEGNPIYQVLKRLLLVMLPALLHIARGELRFVGVKPRTRSEVAQLPEDWRVIYLCSKAGLITEADVRYGFSPSADDLYSAECFYAHSYSKLYDLRLLCRYFMSTPFNYRNGHETDVTPESGGHPRMS